MKSCPYCKEDIRSDAVKCKFCQSSLIAAPDPIAAKPADDRVTYVVDMGLIRFGKFAVAILAMFAIIGVYFFGFDLKNSLEQVRNVQKEAQVATENLKRSQDDLKAAQATVLSLKADVGRVLEQANQVLREIQSQRSIAADLVISIRALTPTQEQALRQERTNDPGKARPGTKFWANGTKLRARFLGGTEQQHGEVRKAASEWIKHTNLTIDFVQDGTSEIRIAFDPSAGSWSYLGTDAQAIPQDKPTMNLAWVERRNVLHEFGHALGLVEEHQNPKANIQWNKPLVVSALRAPPNNWTEARIEHSVFARVAQAQLGNYREFDPTSIMNMEFPPEWTGGIRITVTGELSDSDRHLIAEIYPK
jgi:hypothetical protein